MNIFIDDFDNLSSNELFEILSPQLYDNYSENNITIDEFNNTLKEIIDILLKYNYDKEEFSSRLVEMLNSTLKVNATNITNDSFKMYLNDLKAYPVLNEEETKEYLMKIKNGDLEAKEYFINCNLRLVIYFARRYFKYSFLSFQDLVQEGSIGLMKAVEKFDYDKGAKFSTYASFWIMQSITRAIYEKERSIKLPYHLLEKLSNYEEVYDKLYVEYRRVPKDSEIAKRMGISEYEVGILKLANEIPISLNKKLKDSEDTDIEFFVPDENVDVEKTAIDNSLREELIKAIQTTKLKERDRLILYYRYGLIDNKIYTLQETSKILKISSERIRQIEKKTLDKIRCSSASSKLLPYLYSDVSLVEKRKNKILSDSRQVVENMSEELKEYFKNCKLNEDEIVFLNILINNKRGYLYRVFTKNETDKFKNNIMNKISVKNGVTNFIQYIKSIDDYENKFYPRFFLNRINEELTTGKKPVRVINEENKDKKIYDYFQDYSKKEIDKAISLLDDDYKEILYKRFGHDLENPTYMELNKNDSNTFAYGLLKKIRYSLKK